MERNLPEIRFAAGSYSVTLTVEGPATQEPKFEHTLDKMFQLWLVITGADAIGINSFVGEHAKRGEDFLKTTTQAFEYNVGENTVTLGASFLTDMEGLDEVKIAALLAKLSYKTQLVLDAFAKGTRPVRKWSFMSGLLGDLFGSNYPDDVSIHSYHDFFTGRDESAPFSIPRQ
jgi:hypothetical protein